MIMAKIRYKLDQGCFRDVSQNATSNKYKLADTVFKTLVS